jgi:hypothetical protein
MDFGSVFIQRLQFLLSPMSSFSFTISPFHSFLTVSFALLSRVRTSRTIKDLLQIRGRARRLRPLDPDLTSDVDQANYLLFLIIFQGNGRPNFRAAMFSKFNSTASSSRNFLDSTGSGNKNVAYAAGTGNPQTSHQSASNDTQDYMFGNDFRDWSGQIERAAKIIFPLGFMMFNGIYWAVYYDG